jgi:hypothetical protein
MTAQPALHAEEIADETAPLEPNTWRISVQYVTDEEGNRTHVVIPNDQFEKLLDDLEDLWDIRAFEAARRESNGQPGRPAAEVFAEIERERGWTTQS